MQAPIGRSTRAIDRYDTAYVPNHLLRRRGHALYFSRTGITFDYDMSKAAGPLLQNLHYFYIVSCPVPAIDPWDNLGKCKIGYSSATANTTPHFAYRINEYRRFYGDAVKLHCILIFRRGDMARDFESAIKRLTREMDENGSNEAGVHQPPRQHEWFRLNDLPHIMRIVEDLREEPYWNAQVAPPRRAIPRAVRALG